ncbi:MAG: leucine--tRNA ligase [Chloroflexi bacterium]|nr:leucine--tRNA ligase [Chloroflexota bacterium]
MDERYRPQAVEATWQQRWADTDLYRAVPDPSRPKWYALTMYPYPSGDLHIGHWYAMAPSDVAARYRRMRGYNVLFPMGFDAFGLPAENAAIKRGIHPWTWTMDNIAAMRRQLRTMGTMFDWSREIVTCDPAYYRWNQWLFLKFHERGLAYKKVAAAWWCPNCQTVLANEQVVDGRCERCETEVYRRDLDQWFLAITRYADELLADLDRIDWPERVKTLQRNWIGRSEGAEAEFAVAGADDASIRVFTTRPDTIFGVTFMVLAPEHPLVESITTPAQRAAVDAYVAQTRRETEIDRLSTERDKTGVFTGAYAINPLSGERVPIFIADYVLVTYGTGAIMGVPAHDVRDNAFARRYDVPIPVVIAPANGDVATEGECFTGYGVMVNSSRFSGMTSQAGGAAVAAELAERGLGRPAVTYRLRDWLISRQRYWGTPIPIVYCDTHGIQPVPLSDLPVRLPEDAAFEPTGQSPLLSHEGFLRTTCPICGGPARRETDTMDTFIDSSWYQFRYVSPNDDAAPFDQDGEGAYWLPVDQYTGGIEHAVMHLLYARFFTKAMRDVGVGRYDEPFLRLYNQGVILGPDGNRMSKSRGNVVNPDDYVGRYGADVVRIYLMFIGPWDQGGPWSMNGIEGAARLVQRAWTVATTDPADAPAGEAAPAEITALRRWTHRTIERVTGDIEQFRFNTMVAALMEFVNELMRARATPLVRTAAWPEAIATLTLLLAPSAPHLAEEIWARLGRPYSVHQQPWPTADAALAAAEEVELVVQVNGKVRDRLTVAVDLDEAAATAAALASPRVTSLTQGKAPRRVIYVPGRLINIVQ